MFKCTKSHTSCAFSCSHIYRILCVFSLCMPCLTWNDIHLNEHDEWAPTMHIISCVGSHQRVVCVWSAYHGRATVAFSGQSQEKVGGAPHTCTSRLHDIIIIRLWAYFSFPSLPSKTRTLCGALPIRITSVCVHVVNVNARKLDSILFGTWLVGGFHIAFC